MDVDPAAAARISGLRAAIAAGGEAGELLARIDWSRTSLGPMERWPQSLVSSVSILLASHAQIVMFWGADYVALYNNAYAPTIGDKHTVAFGQPAEQNWSELWDTLEPLLAQVRTSGVAFSGRDYPFRIERRGYAEDVYFDISYDPVRIEDGSVGGVFCIVSETTVRVLAERRLALLGSIDGEVLEATDAASVIAGLRTALGGDCPDIPFARLVLGPHHVASLRSVTEIGSVPTELPYHDAISHGVQRDLLVDGAVAAVRFPLRAGGSELGSVLLGVNPSVEFDAAYRRFLRSVAERLAAAIRTAQVYEAEHRVAATLQRAILPAELDRLPGVELAASYLPATAGLDVGGDWYDALPLPNGLVALAIGDVAGKGLQAAALMGQLRNALRAYLLEGHEPAAALVRLNELARRTATPFATALVAVLDPKRRTVRWAGAGHLPPLLLSGAGEASFLELTPGPPIGVRDGSYPMHARDLSVGDTIVLFTDGIVEGARQDIDSGLSRIREAARTSDDPAKLVHELVRVRPPTGRPDDIAIIAARLAPR